MSSKGYVQIMSVSLMNCFSTSVSRGMCLTAQAVKETRETSFFSGVCSCQTLSHQRHSPRVVYILHACAFLSLNITVYIAPHIAQLLPFHGGSFVMSFGLCKDEVNGLLVAA